VVITERGRPVARLSGIDVAPLLDRLAEQGHVSAAANDRRPTARGRRRVKARGSVADLVVVERDARR
jgi:antitoxin (DNA-binding transcriptional repressor) of toxin-antitoxin stability system